ncbi:MAG TPA: hypothetical protein VFD37_07040 [Solirubrobacterales bacterium]|nr:hypothetical protein [Solirubrobacterales bacterium]
MQIGGGFAPTTLPANRNAPISLQGYAHIKTKDGSHPPALTRLTIEYDKHGRVETRGLRVCRRNQLENTTVQDARRACRGTIVGNGFGKAVIKFPDQAPIPASTPLTIFNGPRVGGDPTVLAHAYLTVPVPTTFVVPVRIQRINKGRFGYRTEARIPAIAGGYGSSVYGRIKVGQTWRFKGRRLSYINARCVGGRLQARGFFNFRDGSSLTGSLFRPCKVRR